MIGENTRQSLPYQSRRARIQHAKRIFVRVALDTKMKKEQSKRKEKRTGYNIIFSPLHNRLGCVCLSFVLTFIGGGPIVFDVVRTQDVGRQRQQPPATAGPHRYGSNVVVRPTTPLTNNNVAHQQLSREQSLQRQHHHFRNPPVRGRTELQQQHKRMVHSGQRRPVIANQLSVLTPNLSQS